MAKPVTHADRVPRLVIAIDFGSYASGYAFQWRTDYENNPLDIHANTKWPHEQFCTYKTPTRLLLKPDRTLARFGYKAELEYYSLKDEGQNPNEWYFFKNYKMILYRATGDIDCDTPVEGADGKHLPTKTVFSRSIEFIKREALEHLKKNNLPYLEDETKWVLTVPAIWADKAKSIMRESAIEAGIKDENLCIALEPECAAIYCSQLSPDQLKIKDSDGNLKHVASPGSTVMVVDLGGGTVDITTVKINADSTMEHVYASGGGPWGGMRVDDKFSEFIRDMVGSDVAEKFGAEHQNEECDLQMAFECAKRDVKHPSDRDSGEKIRMSLPSSLKKLWEEANGNKTVSEIIRGRSDLNGKVTFSSGRLCLSLPLVHTFFERAINDIIGYINNTFSEQTIAELQIDCLIAVGGFAMSSYVVESLRKAMQKRNIPVVRPEDTELAVLNGAVLFGQNEAAITSRIIRYTYGVAFTMEFIDGKHKKEELYVDKGKHFANNVFRKHVTVGQSIKLGEWISMKEYYPVDDKISKETVHIFASEKKDPTHTTDIGCFHVGHFDIDIPTTVPLKQRTVEISMNFGGTELRVRSYIKATNKTFIRTLKLKETKVCDRIATVYCAE